ncbi:MAG: alginate O-acetyltransferase complex protein AlgI, partial [Saprospiraceae bacterium]
MGIKKWSKFRTPLLAFSLIINLGALAIFKYAEFVAVIIHDLFIKVGININLTDNIPEFALILPIGISFYTFQSLSYTIDIYRGRLKPTKNILHFFAYLSMFPQLVAGPIIRAKDFLKQLNTYKIPNPQAVWHGIKLIVYGLFQKMVIADNLSLLIDSAYEGVSVFDGSTYWWVIVVAFSFQIYCDFSGYSLIARGLAKLMGYQFKMNFNHPYLSSSFKSFWNNWHISLSTWFRDYVYIPLGGSKKGVLYDSFALLITFLLSGVWHGASYNFILWAGLHVTFLLLERAFKQITKRFGKQKLASIISLPLVFISSTIAWVYFRSDDVVQAN